jgi:hypothetical protein
VPGWLGKTGVVMENPGMWPFTRRSPEERREDRELKRLEKKRELDDWIAHRDRLDRAAAISSTMIVCHRDTWNFADFAARSSSSAHYRPPAHEEIQELPNGMREVRLSGPNLVALLIVTRNKQRSWLSGSDDTAIAQRIYTAIAAVVDTVDVTSNSGTVPPIVIDAATRSEAENPD